MTKAGVGILDVSVEVLKDALHLLPSTYRIIGSRHAENGVVRLLLESDDISPDAGLVPLTCTVADAGSTRTVRIAAQR